MTEKHGIVTPNIHKTGYAKVASLVKMPLPTRNLNMMGESMIESEEIDNIHASSVNVTGNIGNLDDGQKEISSIEVMRHSSMDDAWTIVDGIVYDITGLIKKHPGGFDKIFQAVGKDGSKYFKQGHFAVDSTSFLQKYEIGIVKNVY
mmetsp:Transcript_18845/g.18003  ORF Transcript_18845/g.18003 Transcript_18845/m.18003 type:complete len:147 (+) Transcript_18845:378-818(+)